MGEVERGRRTSTSQTGHNNFNGVKATFEGAL